MEIVIASNEAAREAHRAVYRFKDNSYIIAEGGLFESIAGFAGAHEKLHIASNWIDIVRLATWKREPSLGDVLLLLRNIGVKGEELSPFKNSGISDIFPWLYYGKRFDLLRKICSHAKTNAERNLNTGNMRILCHLISEETSYIVASST